MSLLLSRREKALSNRSKGILCILFTAFSLSTMSVFVRLSGSEIPAIQKAFVRNAVAVVISAAAMLRSHTPLLPKKENVGLLLLRSSVGAAAVWANFYAIDHLVLADANMLNKLSPFCAILFSALILREKPAPVQLGGVVVALLGSALIIKPGFADAPVGDALIGLMGGVGAGFAYTIVRKLGLRGENGTRIVFFFSAFSFLAFFPLMLPTYVPMSMRQLLLLILASAFGVMGQFGVTRAYHYAPAREISVYDYSQILFAALFGFLFFDQLPDRLSLLGYVLIIGAGIVMFLYRRKD